MEMMTRFLGWVVMAVFLAEPLPADTNAASAPVPPTDPFIKKNAPNPAEATGPQANLILTYEFYTLGQADGARLLQGDATDQERYDQLRELVKQGKARLDNLMCGALADGWQVNLEQADVFPYPIGYFLPSGAKTVSASDFKKRNLGSRLVLKVQTIRGDKACDVSMFPEYTRLQGFIDRQAWIGAYSFTAPQPVFETQRVNIKPPILPFDQICLISTFSPSGAELATPDKAQPQEPAKEPEMGLIFAHASRVEYEAGAAAGNKPTGVSLELSAYSMERDQALQILSQPVKPGSVYEAVQSLVKVNQAKLEHVAVLRTRDALKSNCDEVSEDICSTGGSDEWVTQDVGFSAEVRPQLLGNGNVVDLDVTKYQFLKDIGPVQDAGFFGTLAASQPIFENQSIDTKINAAVGEHALLGTINPAGDTGIPGTKDGGRVWLAFIQATTVNP